MKQIRKRLTYANVMSSIAVFLILGGATAFAASKIGANRLKANSVLTGKIKKEAVTTSKIKNNAITTSKIADKAVTGAKIDVGSLGTVPNATNAQNANNANNANTVGGLTIKKFFYASNETTAKTTLVSLGGLTLTASCEGGTPQGIATTSVPGESTIHAGGSELGDEAWYEEDDSFEPGEEQSFVNESESDSNEGTLTFTTSGGSVVTAVFLSEEGTLDKDCVISGHITG